MLDALCGIFVLNSASWRLCDLLPCIMCVFHTQWYVDSTILPLCHLHGMAHLVSFHTQVVYTHKMHSHTPPNNVGTKSRNCVCVCILHRMDINIEAQTELLAIKLCY